MCFSSILPNTTYPTKKKGKERKSKEKCVLQILVIIIPWVNSTLTFWRTAANFISLHIMYWLGLADGN